MATMSNSNMHGAIVTQSAMTEIIVLTANLVADVSQANTRSNELSVRARDALLIAQRNLAQMERKLTSQRAAWPTLPARAVPTSRVRVSMGKIEHILSARP
jgi:hypothetical protein